MKRNLSQAVLRGFFQFFLIFLKIFLFICLFSKKRKIPRSFLLKNLDFPLIYKGLGIDCNAIANCLVGAWIERRCLLWIATLYLRYGIISTSFWNKATLYDRISFLDSIASLQSDRKGETRSRVTGKVGFTPERQVVKTKQDASISRKARICRRTGQNACLPLGREC